MTREFYGATYKINIEEIYSSDSKNYYLEYKPHWVELAKLDLKRRNRSKSPSRFDILFSLIRNFPKVKTLDSAPFKILVIHEANKLERVLQQALRRTMEKYSRSCRFIFISDSISNIIKPIRSRCILLKFFPLNTRDFLGKIKYICNSENLTITDEGLSLIDYYSNKDMSIAINLIQAASVYTKNITDEIIYQIIKEITPIEIKEIIQLALNGEIIGARDKLRKLFLKRGFTGKAILKLFNNSLMNSPLPVEIKERISLKISDFDQYLVECNTEEIQLSFFLAYLGTLGIKTSIVG